MWLIAASATCGIAVVFAIQLARSQQRLLREMRALRSRLRSISERVESVERSVGEATTQAEVAGAVLLEKGIADEEELEAARRRSEPNSGEPVPVRGTRTIH
jgi:hypothetical protein